MRGSLKGSGIKKRLVLFPVLLALAVCFQLPVASMALQFEPSFAVDAQAVYAVNQETETVVFEKNAHEKIYPASTTKIMTVLLTLENVSDLQSQATYRQPLYQELNQINQTAYGGMLSMAGLSSGETLTVEKLIYGAMLPSGNECAYILAEFVGDGSVEEFVAMMNERAKALGMKNTQFSNPAGLEDEQNYSTAYDMYLLTKEAMKNPLFQKAASTAEYEAGPTNLHDTLPLRNTNKTLFSDSDYYDPSNYGIKTGTLDSSGRCFISAARQNGLSYFTVMMNAPYLDETGAILPYNAAFQETQKLYEWMFSTFVQSEVVAKGQSWKDIPIQLAGEDKLTVKVMTDGAYQGLLPKGTTLADFETRETYLETLFAPIETGAPVGEVTLTYQGEQLATIPLVSAETVERDLYQYLRYEATNIFQQYGVYILAGVLLLLTLMVFGRIRRRKKRRSRRR